MKKPKWRRRNAPIALPNTLPLLAALLPMAFFYLRQFQATCECCGFRLAHHPYAHNGALLDVAPVVTLDARGVSVNGYPEKTQLEPGGIDKRIDGVFEDLLTLKANYALLHPGERFPGRVVLDADVNTPFWMIERVRYTALVTGYPTIDYLVDSGDD